MSTRPPLRQSTTPGDHPLVKLSSHNDRLHLLDTPPGPGERGVDDPEKCRDRDDTGDGLVDDGAESKG